MASTDELLAMYTRVRNRPSREEIILSHVGVVKHELGRLPLSHLAREEYSELVGQGVVGLVEAVDHFGFATGPSFEAYATSHVKATIVGALERQTHAPSHFGMSDGASGSPEPGLSAAMYSVGRAATISLHSVVEMGGLDSAASLPEALSALPEAEALLLSLYYADGLTLTEIAVVLAVAESEACMLLGRAVTTLNAQLQHLKNRAEESITGEEPTAPVAAAALDIPDASAKAEGQGRGLSTIRGFTGDAIPLRRSEAARERRFVRVPCALDSEFAWTDASGTHSRRSVAANISCGGLNLRVASSERPRLGALGTVHLALPRFPERLHLQVRVLRADGSSASGWRVGVVFVNAPPRERDQIASYIWHRREFLVQRAQV